MGDAKGGPVYKGLGKIPDRLLFLFAGLVYLFLYAPILVLIFFSFNSTKNTQVWTGFSMQWYGDLIRDGSVLNAFKLSLIVGLTATAIATVIGTLTALALSRNEFRGKTFADSAIYAATVMPEIVVGVSLLVFFVAATVELGIVTIIIAHVAFCISFVTIVVRARLSGMDRSVEEAAQDLGANPVQTFLRVTLPLILPGVMAGSSPGVHPLLRRLRDNVLRLRGRVEHAAFEDLLHDQVRRQPRDQRALDGGYGHDDGPDPWR